MPRWFALELAGDEPGPEVVLTRRTYAPLELFLFSAASWHPHRIHFDHPYATGVEGHDALVVHGPLQAVHAVDALLDALDVPVTVRSLTYRHHALLTVGQEAVVKARSEPVDEEGSSATFEVWMERAGDGERTTTVMVTIVVPDARTTAAEAANEGETTA
jgi:hydroxyacyl-ACP dehydratase HTD2-like protein with hotdog domain